MNIGEFPQGMRAERRDLIEALEAFGYDTMPGVQKDWADWRDRASDAQMRTVIANLTVEEAKRLATASGEPVADRTTPDQMLSLLRPFGHPDAPEADAEFPDISELVAAIDEIVAARDAFAASMTVADAARQDRAFNRCRELQKQIAKAQEAAFHA